MTELPELTATPTTPPGPPARRPRGRMALAALLLLGGGLAAGAGATALVLHRQRPVLVSLTPAPIASMKPWNAVALKGSVAEVFGHAFVVEDGSGRALVDTGPAGDDAAPVTTGEAVIVQGRFEHGVVHAMAIQHADGRTDMVGPPGPPPPPGPGPRGGATPGQAPLTAPVPDSHAS